ncbi:hypothetical protein V501_02160 [Pseudogymnoascus sp. VKM F-4519 (FW-2642)]|nr:hypothetical protein V501_02160 [Pseudogymnoascus sp. VKM F-4519 (FW-2642)]
MKWWRCRPVPPGANSVSTWAARPVSPDKGGDAGHHFSETSSEVNNQSRETGSQSDEPKATPDPEPCNQEIKHQSILSRQITPQFTQERLETDIQDAVERVARKSIYPVKTADGIVDWFSTDDPPNP